MSEKIGFVGVGRMGANMARRLKECGYPIAAVYDVNTAAAQALAQELGSVAADQLKVVTALSDVIITVVTDDKAMKSIYGGGLLVAGQGKGFHQLRDDFPGHARLGGTKMRGQGRRIRSKPAWHPASIRHDKARSI
jgi:hypothetical protein